uniref:Integrase catalytic domain-containing protein n=1 Tax=Cacopsylla melanoneura TaxID=428564 RepID=A0A8D8SS13_9HEMI
MTARAFHYAKRNLFKITVELKEKYRDIDVTEENLHYFKVAAAEMVEAFQEFERTRREYEPNHSDPDPNVSILTDEEENTMSSCKRFIRLLNAKIATFEGDRQLEHEERQRTDELAFRERQQEQQRDDEMSLRDRQRIDELALRVRQLEADTALRQQELTSKERIELERIRLTAATQPETNHRSGLPKIELTKFSGDVTTFTEFIDSFNALVHNRSDLKANEKFHYLKSVVLGPVAKLIEGIRVTDANYQIALDLLKETYGSKPVIVTKLFDELNELKPVSWKPNDLYSFYQNVEVKFKLLENEGCNLENEIVRSVLFRKLPTSVQSELVKEKGLTFTTQDLRNVINKEAKTYIAINSFKSPGTVNSFLPTAPATTFVPRANVNFRPNPSSLPTNRFPNIRASQRLPTTHSLVTNRSQECMFCKGLHLSDDCKLGLGERKGKLVGTCYLCLKNDHLFTQCNERNSYKCSHCNCVGHHNRVLCPTYIYPPNNNNGKYRPNNNRNSFVPRQNHDQRKGEGSLLASSNVPTFANNDVCNFPSLVNCSNNIPPSPYSSQDCRNDPSLSMTTQNDPSSLSSSDNYRVYLQSATVLVRNKSTNRDIEVYVVFDSGATASYITESLVKKLGLKYDYSRDVNVYTFGNTQPKTIPMNITKVELIDKVGRVYELTVNQIPTIAGSVSNSVCPKIIENLSRTYELADKYLTKPGNQTYDLLIGNDYYTSLMRNNTIQVNDQLYLLDSVFGYLLSGKVYYDTIIPKESTTLFVHLDRPLSHEHDLRLLWDMETLGVKENATLTDDDLALQKFESAIRYENNRYYVDFPWKDGCKEDVQSNFGIAIGRLRSLVKRHAKDGVLDACKTNFDEQLKLGILERVDSSPNNTKSHYLPYHAVIRTERETTKIRVVIDATLIREIVDDLDTIPNYDIPRLVGTITDTTYLELHGFSDACMYAYGATVHVRCINGSDISCNLVFAKIRISPKNITLPRLELMGALVAYRCLLYVTKSLHRAVSKVFLWSDSTCVLHWIHTRKLLPVFVKNRVNEIRSGDLDIVFKYVRTHHNPADLCRGQSGKSLKNNALWWHGPEFLCKIEKDWPLENIDFGNVNLDSENPLYENSEIDLLADTGGKEKNKIKVSSPCKIDESEFTSFSDLISHTCIVKRGGDNRAPISNIEYTAARNDWLKYLQSNHFSQTINSLESGKKDSLSINLGLELDSNGILILKGRFVEMKVDGENPFPILLPRKDHLTDIIVLDIHVKCFHVGVNQTLATLRNDYWLTSGRTEIKRILKSCDTCKMFNSKPYATPEFSSFPNYRLQKNLAFTYSAVDYFGPLYVKDGKSKSRSIWCLLFTCLTTRAIHLELVDSESSSDLLLAFRRFLARTGGCKSLLSDNAAQFQLLQKTFQHMYSDNDSHGILNKNKIDFRFTPALSPWAGGCFERLISITKQCLRKTIGNITLTLCQLTTLISEIEHIINSRPLGYFGEEDFIITPNHFLGIKRDSFLPDLSSCSEPRNQGAVSTLVREWKKGNQYLEVFWLKWSSQYIQSLRERNDTKWKSGKVAHRVPKVNDVVLVRQPKKKNREMWPHGVIVKLHFGRDKQVRHVDVKLPTGVVISRPISWLYPFECDE